MEYAPIIIFAFNRLDSLKNTITSLLKNEEAKDSDMFVFVDGARPQKEGEDEKVEIVRNFVKSITGFRQVTYTFANENNGLGNSIIAGVSLVINQYGRAIVLEDDLVFSSNFLSFMNQGLNLCEDKKDVFSVCGYSNKIKVPKDYLCDAYFCTRSSSWGWATWADRWNSVDWELKDWDSYVKYKKSFNRWGGTDCWKMLNDWHNGRNKSWAIRFCFAQFLQDKLSLFPIVSKVTNEGFDGQGTNCKAWSRFKCDFDTSGTKEFDWPKKRNIDERLFQKAMKYHSLLTRLWSRIMYKLYK